MTTSSSSSQPAAGPSTRAGIKGGSYEPKGSGRKAQKIRPSTSDLLADFETQAAQWGLPSTSSSSSSGTATARETAFGGEKLYLNDDEGGEGDEEEINWRPAARVIRGPPPKIGVTPDEAVKVTGNGKQRAEQRERQEMA